MGQGTRKVWNVACRPVIRTHKDATHPTRTSERTDDGQRSHGDRTRTADGRGARGGGGGAERARERAEETGRGERGGRGGEEEAGRAEEEPRAAPARAGHARLRPGRDVLQGARRAYRQGHDGVGGSDFVGSWRMDGALASDDRLHRRSGYERRPHDSREMNAMAASEKRI